MTLSTLLGLNDMFRCMLYFIRFNFLVHNYMGFDEEFK